MKVLPALFFCYHHPIHIEKNYTDFDEFSQ